MMPRRERETGRWALSTARVDGLAVEEKRVFGEAWVRRHLGQNRSLKAHCEVPVEAIESAGGRLLHTDYDRMDTYNTPPRHVNVLGWPDEEDAQLAIAQELCALIETRGHVERY